jgi:hypothetical protein
MSNYINAVGIESRPLLSLNRFDLGRVGVGRLLDGGSGHGGRSGLIFQRRQLSAGGPGSPLGYGRLISGRPRLIGSRCGEPLRIGRKFLSGYHEVVGISAPGPHFLELAAHGVPLKKARAQLAHPDKHEHSGRDSQPTRPISDALAVIYLGTGLAGSIGASRGVTYWVDRRGGWIAAGALFAFQRVFTIQSVILLVVRIRQMVPGSGDDPEASGRGRDQGEGSALRPIVNGEVRTNSDLRQADLGLSSAAIGCAAVRWGS